MGYENKFNDMTSFQMGSVLISNVFVELKFSLPREWEKRVEVNKAGVRKIAQNETRGIRFKKKCLWPPENDKWS